MCQKCMSFIEDEEDQFDCTIITTINGKKTIFFIMLCSVCWCETDKESQYKNFTINVNQ